MPPKSKTFSVSTAPASSSPTCRPIVVDTGSSALRRTCRLRTTPGGEALGLGGAHEVLVEHVEHAGPGDPHDDRERDGGQRDARAAPDASARRQAASHSRVSRPSSTKKPVTSVASMSTDCRPDGGNQPSSDREDGLEQVAEEEDRDAMPTRVPTDGGHVQRAAAVPRGQVAQRDAEPTAMISAAMVSSTVAGKRSSELLEHRLAGVGRGAEVAGGHPGQELAVLDEDRLVEADQAVARRAAPGWPARRGRPSPGRRAGCAAR